MTKHEHKQEIIIERAVQQFVDAQLKGQKLDIDDFAKQYPEFETQIKKRLLGLYKIDEIFKCLMQADESDFSDEIEGQDLVGQALGDYSDNVAINAIDFEDLPLGMNYKVGDSFEISKVKVTTAKFFLNNNNSTNEGYAKVENGGAAGGSGKELAIHNINLVFDFGIPLSGLSLQYGEYGGNINLEINGQLINVEDFIDVPKGVGGTSIFTIDAGEHGKSNGIMIIVGIITSFRIGGQNLWIDNLLPSVVPQPNAPKLSEFEITRQIGRGGMGVVFLARQVSLEREVALKVVSDLSGTHQRTLDRFIREAKVLAKIYHPNIVQIYEVGRQGVYSYFAMEFVDGISLDKIITSVRNAGSHDKASDIFKKCLEARDCIYPNKFSEDNKNAEIDKDYIVAISKIIIDIASALQCAHDKNILHRDIKPSNILIDSTGKAKLVDFGLAKSEICSSITITGELFGTPSYISPEQIHCPDKIDCRSDIYSLGATFYECLTLHAPFEGETVDETLTKVLLGGVVPPRKYCYKLPTDLNIVLLHALEKVPDDRYNSAIEFAQDIQNVLDYKPINARRPNVAQRAYRTLRRNSNKVLVVLVIILLIIILYQFFV